MYEEIDNDYSSRSSGDGEESSYNDDDDDDDGDYSDESGKSNDECIAFSERKGEKTRYNEKNYERYCTTQRKKCKRTYDKGNRRIHHNKKGGGGRRSERLRVGK